MPLGGITRAEVKSPGYLTGQSIMAASAFFISFRPPMSCQVTFERSVDISLVAVGSTALNPFRKSSMVIRIPSAASFASTAPLPFSSDR